MTSGFSQYGNLKIKQDTSVNRLVQKKIELDKERYETSIIPCNCIMEIYDCQ